MGAETAMVRRRIDPVLRRLSSGVSHRRAIGGLAALVGALMAPTWLGWAVAHENREACQTHVAHLRLAHPHVVVLKGRRLLHLFDDQQLVRSYPIDLGRDPVGPKARNDDGRTPEGRFQVVTRNATSPYGQFLGISYPDVCAVERGVDKGYLSPGEADEIRAALAAGRCPSWTTPLGGGLGLHGGGRGEDWTAGCIALRDADMEELFAVLRAGDVVEILP